MNTNLCIFQYLRFNKTRQKKNIKLVMKKKKCFTLLAMFKSNLFGILVVSIEATKVLISNGARNK